MVSVRPIRSESDYEAALKRVWYLMRKLSPPEGQIDDPDDSRFMELDVLTDLVERYEERHHPIGLPSVVAAIEFEMDQRDLKPGDLVPFIGSRSKVSEVLSGKRDITMAMARALHAHLGVPADVLLREPGAMLPETAADIEWTRFPLRAMANAGWIDNERDLKGHAEELVRSLIARAGGGSLAVEPMYRKNDHVRINAKTDDYALRAWCWRVMGQARERGHKADYERGTVTLEFLRAVARLSPSEDGPVRARSFLEERGIGLEYVPHLRRTHLDGAALRLGNTRPVVGLTLRYDRIDNFWYTLLHELAHIGLHLDSDADNAPGYVDDHSLRNVESDAGSREYAADRMAEDALIPPDIWEEGVVQVRPTPMAVMDLSWEAGVHPAIVAGRVRYETGNYRLLSQFVGTGEVRRLLKA